MSVESYEFNDNQFVAFAQPDTGFCTLFVWDHVEMVFRKYHNITGTFLPRLVPSKNKHSCQKTINAFNCYHLIIDQGNLHCILEQTTSLSTQRILKSAKPATFCFCVSPSSLRCLLQACGNKQHSLHGCGSTFWRIPHLQVRLIPIPISNTVSLTCSFS